MNVFFLYRYFAHPNSSPSDNRSGSTELNSRIMELLGKTPEELVARPMINLVSERSVVENAGLLVLHYLQNMDSLSALRILNVIPETGEMPEWQRIYRTMLRNAAERVCRKISVEEYENRLEEISWNDLGEQVLQEAMVLIATTYLEEDLPEHRKKCKPWLDRLMKEGNPYSFLALTRLYDYYLTSSDPSSQQNLGRLTNQLENAEPSTPEDRHLLSVMRFRARIREVIEFPGQASAFFAKTASDLTDREKYTEVQQFCFYFSLLTDIHPLFASLEENQAVIQSQMLLGLEEKISVVSGCIRQNPDLRLRMSAVTIPFWVYSGKNKIAWEHAQELIHFLREKGCFRPVIQLGEFLSIAWMNAQMAGQAEKFLMQNIRYLLDRKDSFEAEALVNLIRFLNQLFEKEFSRPGVSALKDNLTGYFALQEQVIHRLEENLPETGHTVVTLYLAEGHRLAGIARHNIRTSLSIALLQTRLLGLACKINGNREGHQVSQDLLAQFRDTLSPLHFATADWEEFKDIPNDIRNKIINRSISITKGDLPAAADHLVFSYRNLRSYISQDEVNRLGNFLHERHTSSRSLEEGIRLMFYDMYLNGHIFDVVFDMPAFLIRKSGIGFSPRDMETTLEIKPSTAKKYIRLLLASGMIESGKTEGKKVTYKLSIDKIMRRYAEEKAKRIS